MTHPHPASSRCIRLTARPKAARHPAGRVGGLRGALALAVAALLALGACAGTPETLRGDDGLLTGPGREPDDREANRAALEELRDRARNAEPSTATPPNPSPERDLEVVVLGPERVAALTSEGSLKRSVVDAFVAQGPHAVLGAVDLEPAYNANGGVLGFRIARIQQGGEFITEAGLREGDVVRSVNGHPITMPDRFIAAFQGLTEASAVDVVVVRDGAESVLSWAIDDAQ